MCRDHATEPNYSDDVFRPISLVPFIRCLPTTTLIIGLKGHGEFNISTMFQFTGTIIL